MRKLSVILLLVIACGPATRTSMNVNEGNYSKVFNTEKTKTEAYNASLEWIAKSYNNPKLVTQTADKEEGILIIKGNNDLTVGVTKLPFRHIITIRTKDNAVKVEFEQQSNNSGYYPPAESMNESEQFFKAVVLTISDYINKYEAF